MDYVIFALVGDYSKVAEELEKELKPEEKSSGDEMVSLHQFDMLSQAYEEKFAECELLKVENRNLIEKLSRYRYFIECQKNEIEKL